MFWHEEQDEYPLVTDAEYTQAAYAFKDELYKIDKIIRAYASDIYRKIQNGEQTSNVAEYRNLDREFYDNFSQYCNPQFEADIIVQYSCERTALLYYQPDGGGVLVANMGGTSDQGINLRLGGTTRQRGYDSGYIMSHWKYQDVGEHHQCSCTTHAFCFQIRI